MLYHQVMSRKLTNKFFSIVQGKNSESYIKYSHLCVGVKGMEKDDDEIFFMAPLSTLCYFVTSTNLHLI